jgi:AcrR family transcriptional regulator
MTDTRTRILDTAERLFAEHGYAGTSLRHIISEAGVNLAAVHYHFRSKEGLLEAVVTRRCEALNRERLELLSRFEREAGNRPPDLEKIFEALLVPAFKLARESGNGGALFARLMGRLHAEGDLSPRILKNNFGPVLAAFTRALRRALPGLPEEELLLRIHFAIGAMAHTLRGTGQLEFLSGNACFQAGWQATLESLVQFLSGGFRAPAKAAPASIAAAIQET